MVIARSRCTVLWAATCHDRASFRHAAAAVLWLIVQAIAAAHSTAITVVYTLSAVLVIAADLRLVPLVARSGRAGVRGRRGRCDDGHRHRLRGRSRR